MIAERTGRWAGLFRKALVDVAGRPRGVTIREMRSIKECRDALEQAPTSVVGVELSAANVEAVLGFVDEVNSRFRAASVLVLASYDQRAYEGLARELGAIGFIASPAAVRREAEWISRRLAQNARSKMNVLDRIWAELPWSLGA